MFLSVSPGAGKTFEGGDMKKGKKVDEAWWSRATHGASFVSVVELSTQLLWKISDWCEIQGGL